MAPSAASYGPNTEFLTVPTNPADSKPFTRTKTAGNILASVAHFCRRTFQPDR
jgi:hypothetical protein